MNRIRFSSLFKGCFILIAAAFVAIYIANIVVFLFIQNMHYNKWTATRPENYSIVISYGTFAREGSSTQEVVTGDFLVDNGSNTYSQPTIDYLFDTIKGCVVNPLALLMCTVEYDLNYGYPTKFVENDLDLGRVIQITNFAPES